MAGDLDDAFAAGEGALIADSVAQELRTGRGGGAETCANCGATLAGAHCHACGQVADDLRRPIWSLLKEAIDGLFSLDGRLFTTLPALIFRPGTMTASYLHGARARYVQPFRLYLFCTVVFLIAVSLASWDRPVDQDPIDGASVSLALLEGDLAARGAPAAVVDELRRAQDHLARAKVEPAVAATELAAAERDIGAALDALGRSARPATDLDADARSVSSPWAQMVEREISDALVALRQEAGAAEVRLRAKCEVRRVLWRAQPWCDSLPPGFAPRGSGVTIEGGTLEIRNGDTTVFHLDREQTMGLVFGGPGGLDIGAFLARQADAIIDDPGRFLDAVNTWTARLLIVLFPIYALLLAGVHVWKRRLLFYDHMVVSLHVHAFVFLLLTLLIATWPLWKLLAWPFERRLVVGAEGFAMMMAAAVFLAWSNWGLYRTLRLAYGSGRFSAALRTLVLDVLYLIVLATFLPIGLALGGFLTA